MSFHAYSSLNHSVESYKLKAELILQNFISNTLEEAIVKIEQDCKQNQQTILSEIIKPITPPSKWRSFWSGVGQNVVAAIIVSILIAVLIILFQTRDKGVKNVVEDAFQIKITSKDSVSR